MKKIKSTEKYTSMLFFGGVLLALSCASIVFSPHAQNEMVRPSNQTTEVQEIGGGFAYNKWMINENPETLYIRTYPHTSISLLHNAYMGNERWNRIGGIEVVCLPLQWWVPDASGFCVWFKPHIGFQYCKNVMTVRMNISPLDFSLISENGEYEIEGGLSRFNAYQLSVLLHNYKPSRNTCWIGFRNSPSAVGLLGGGEYLFNNRCYIRAEYSYLMKSPFSIFLNGDELRSIKGSVHYLTIGLFRRMK